MYIRVIFLENHVTLLSNILGLGNSSAITVMIFCSKKYHNSENIMILNYFLLTSIKKYTNIHYYYKTPRFSARKTNMLTFCGRRHAHFSVMMWKAMLNTLSLSYGTDVAGIAKCFVATWESRKTKVFPNRLPSSGSSS